MAQYEEPKTILKRNYPLAYRGGQGNGCIVRSRIAGRPGIYCRKAFDLRVSFPDKITFDARVKWLKSDSYSPGSPPQWPSPPLPFDRDFVMTTKSVTLSVQDADHIEFRTRYDGGSLDLPWRVWQYGEVGALYPKSFTIRYAASQVPLHTEMGFAYTADFNATVNCEIYGPHFGSPAAADLPLGGEVPEFGRRGRWIIEAFPVCRTNETVDMPNGDTILIDGSWTVDGERADGYWYYSNSSAQHRIHDGVSLEIGSCWPAGNQIGSAMAQQLWFDLSV